MPSARPDRLPDALVAALDGIPFNPRDATRDPRYYLGLAKSGLDFVTRNLPRWNDVLVKLHPYPDPWEPVRVPVDVARRVMDARHDGADAAGTSLTDGHLLGGWYGPGRPGAPAVVYAPGTFQTKDDSLRRARALHMHRALGYHVLVVDLRGFGESHATHGTGGFVEAHDLHRAAEWLKARAGVDRVTLMGDSLGGASALIAGALPGAEDRFNGIIAWSPFADLVTQATYATTNPGPRHPFFVAYGLYKLMVYARSHGEARDFNEFLAKRARELGITPDEFLNLGSPQGYACDVSVPTCVFHAEDDPIVPVAQARLLEDACRENPLVRVRVLAAGGHATFDEWCSDWYWGTVQAFVTHVTPGADLAVPARFTTLTRDREAGYA